MFRFLGVFDTVGSLGLPEELVHHSPHIRNIFGFNDRVLGEHIQNAYQALAINETRADFNCCKFEQSLAGRRKGQVLNQCWFTGCHADIGGGYHTGNDLSNLTLFWMAAHLQDHLSLDYTYLGSLPRPIAPWGALPPHDPITGIFALAHQIQRTLPERTDEITHETIHASVLQHPPDSLGFDLSSHQELIAPLLPLEQGLRHRWPTLLQTVPDTGRHSDETAFRRLTKSDTGLTEESGKRILENNWLGNLVEEFRYSIRETLEELDTLDG